MNKRYSLFSFTDKFSYSVHQLYVNITYNNFSYFQELTLPKTVNLQTFGASNFGLFLARLKWNLMLGTNFGETGSSSSWADISDFTEFLAHFKLILVGLTEFFGRFFKLGDWNVSHNMNDKH